ncbi:MAG: hypothetical protein IKH49_10260 [Bacteroidales bacterium]|jgi:hypothetical protein|nr:hypothetical protein [Bacteroidales bacterium]
MKRIEIKSVLLVLTASLLMLGGCRENQTQRRETIPFVRQIAVDSSGTFSLVRNYDETGSAGSVALFGSPKSVLRLVRAFMESDIYDNIDGKDKKDGLPDFAGEVFHVCMDPLYTPYSHFLSSDPDSLRELTVRCILQSLDTLSYTDSFDPESVVPKTRSKVVVLSSPLQAEFGRFDVDTLFKMADKRISLIDPVDALLESVSAETPRHLLVVTSDPVAADTAFASVTKRLAPGSTLDIMPYPEVGLDLRACIRNYSTLGKSYPVTELLLDEDAEVIEQLSETLRQIRDDVAEGDEILRRGISQDFKIVNQTDALVRSCYSLLRRENRFTHDIAYPKALYYQVEESILGEPVLVRVSDRYISSTSSRMKEIQAQISH